MACPSSSTSSPCPVTLQRRTFIKHAGLLILSGTLGLAGCDSGGGADEPEPEPGDPGTGSPETPIGWPGLRVENGDLIVDLAVHTNLEQAGGFLQVMSEDGLTVNVVLINADGSQIRAFSSVCTHLGFRISQFDDGSLHCPSHGSRFDPVTGAVTKGPASDPLPTFTLEQQGTELIVRDPSVLA